MKYFHILIVLTIIIVFLYTIKNKKYYNSKYKYKTYYQCSKGNSANVLFHDVLNANGLSRSYNYNSWDIYLPCRGQYSEKAYRAINIDHPNQIISFISQNGVLGSKQYIWKMLEEYYGRNIASTIMPKSYIFPKDKKIFDIEYNKNSHYVMKSEQQRQKGLEITQDYNKLIDLKSNGYKIIQTYIKNPYTYNGYKVNFRIYLLIVYKNNNKQAYVFNDGIISYAKNLYNDQNINFDNGVASFYTSKELYDLNYPLIFSELKIHESHLPWEQIYRKFLNQIKKVFDASKTKLCSYKHKYDGTTFQIFGVDFILTKDLKPYVLEINIGPGMDPYCERDRHMRLKLHNDILQIIGLTNFDQNNGFKKI